MGQRLNIEIVKNKNVLANCYYHWSGFSNSSIDLVVKIIEDFDYVKKCCLSDPCKNEDLLFAIRLLERTGAGLYDLEETRKILGNPLIKLPKCKGRDEGIIRNNRKRY